MTRYEWEPDQPEPTDTEILADITRREGAGWDDETDMRQRVVYITDESPRVERIRRPDGRARLPHAPGSHWEDTSCLCSCHYVRGTSCDDTECKRNGVTLRRYAEREQARKQRAWERKHGAVAL